MSKQQIGPLQRAWIETMRSGTHTQCKGRLCERTKKKGFDYAHCCLGVACEVAIANGHEVSVEELNGVVSFAARSGGLPDSIRELLQFHSDPGHLRWKRITDQRRKKQLEEWSAAHGRPSSLAVANDNYGWTFEQIADFAELFPESVWRGPA